MLEYKCLLYGKELYVMDGRDRCHRCKGKLGMSLWKRMYRCSNANRGLVMDRDESSVRNIYERFFAQLEPHVSRSLHVVYYTCVQGSRHLMMFRKAEQVFGDT